MDLRFSQLRPVDDIGAARFDQDISRSAVALTENAAYCLIAENIRKLRENCVQDLVEGKKDAEGYRKAIVALDQIFRLHNQLIQAGTDARRWLEENNHGD